MPRALEEQFVIAVYSDNKKGLLGEILMIFNRKGFEVSELNVSKTDIRDMVMISLEVTLPQQQLALCLKKLENIVEVYRAIGYPAAEVALRKIAFYRISNQLFTSSVLCMLQSHGAIIVDRQEESFVIQKSGSDKDLDLLYKELEGKNLISFFKSGLVTANSLIPLDSLFCSA